MQLGEESARNGIPNKLQIHLCISILTRCKWILLCMLEVTKVLRTNERPTIPPPPPLTDARCCSVLLFVSPAAGRAKVNGKECSEHLCLLERKSRCVRVFV